MMLTIRTASDPPATPYPHYSLPSEWAKGGQQTSADRQNRSLGQRFGTPRVPALYWSRHGEVVWFDGPDDDDMLGLQTHAGGNGYPTRPYQW